VTMGNSTSEFTKTLGVDLKGSCLAVEDKGIVNYLVTRRRESNYLKYCADIEVPSFDCAETIRKYTDHETKLYLKTNLSLASDSPTLAEHGLFANQLRQSILRHPFLEQGPLYRGVELGDLELQKMEELKDFFIPSFTSTSVNRSQAYSKNAMLVIRPTFACKSACSVTAELSKHYGDEHEVLIACYSGFRLERVEKVGNMKVVTLYLDDYLSMLPQI